MTRGKSIRGKVQISTKKMLGRVFTKEYREKKKTMLFCIHYRVGAKLKHKKYHLSLKWDNSNSTLLCEKEPANNMLRACRMLEGRRTCVSVPMRYENLS